LAPGLTGSGESVFTTEMSADLFTVVIAVEELLAEFGSAPSSALALAVAVLEMTVPSGVPGLTCTTIVRTTDPPEATPGNEW
jgi:hypothetical protein